MRQTRYLNIILTVNAVLLGALLWTALIGRPLLSEPAEAQVRTRFTVPPNVPNAGAQRAAIVNELREMNALLDSTRDTLLSGRIKVQVTNVDSLRQE